MRNFEPARKRVDVTVGESVRIIRELQGMSQNELARISGIPQSTISAIENDRINLGVERAKTLAKVYISLSIHRIQANRHVVGRFTLRGIQNVCA